MLRTISLLALSLMLMASAAIAADACSVVIPTSGKAGTVTADLTGLPKNAVVFRAELVLNPLGHLQPRSAKPTKVYPEGQPDKPLPWIAPRFVSLDALEAVKAAIKDCKPLSLVAESTINGVARLEVSCVGGKPEKALPAVKDVKLLHRAGQTFITFVEPVQPSSMSAQAPWDGKLASVAVKAGDKVAKGQLLAKMDPTDKQKKLDELKAGLEQSKDKAKTQKEIKDIEADLTQVEIKSLCDGVAAGEPKAAGAALKAGEAVATFDIDLAPGAYPDLPKGRYVSMVRDAAAKKSPGLRFRIWRSGEKITPETIAKAELVGEVSPLSVWNSRYHQDGTAGAAPMRYAVVDNQPLTWGTGVYAHNPPKAGKGFYAVTACVNGEEDFSKLAASAEGVDETVGLGEPVLQEMQQVKGWQYRTGPLTRLIYVRWENGPHSSTPSNPIDYLVVMGDEPKTEGLTGEAAANRAFRVEPAPVGLHLHCWGGSAEGGYGWWHNAHRGAILIASTQIPYDWWTGYHEANGTSKSYGDGFVQAYTMKRVLGFLDWAVTQHEKAPDLCRKHWRKLDLTRVFTAGSSMGGAGAPMYPIRYGDRIAWCIAWVGVHIPAESPTYTGSYEGSYGPVKLGNKMADGTSAWDYFSDEWYLRQNPKAETGFIMASNGMDDDGIGWPQARKFARALQETRRPHIFNWALGGHGTRTLIGPNFDLDVRTDQTLPAFTNCSLDSNIGTAKPLSKEEQAAEKAKQEEEKTAGKRQNVAVGPFDGDPFGQYNGYLWWQTDDIVDKADAWEMTVILKPNAPKDECKVDLTPRRLQQFKTPKGAKFAYTVTDESGKQLSQGTASADELDLLTLKQITLQKGKNRVKIATAK